MYLKVMSFFSPLLYIIEYFGAVESVKAASDLNSPLPGTVLAANEVLVDNPETINKSPTDEGTAPVYNDPVIACVSRDKVYSFPLEM